MVRDRDAAASPAYRPESGRQPWIAYATSKPATTSQAVPLIDLCIVVTVGDEGLGRGVLVG